MKTTLHTYSFDISKPEDKKAYDKLYKKLIKDRECFNVLDFRNRKDIPHAGPIVLETENIFDNQWNTSTHRIFDWYEGIVPNHTYKSGYYLDITPEMKEIRRNTMKCGYCGHMEPAAKGLTFCETCLDSEYLKEDDLHLLRFKSVSDIWHRKQLTSAEKAYLLPLYVSRQTTGTDSRNANKLRKQRKDIVSKCKKATKSLKTEKDGMLWLMDHNVNIDNVIYYDHTDVFSFGWRSPVSDSIASKLLDIISEFPHKYEIKGTSRTWENQ